MSFEIHEETTNSLDNATRLVITANNSILTKIDTLATK